MLRDQAVIAWSLLFSDSFVLENPHSIISSSYRPSPVGLW
jgi:hypothetical protein